MLLPYQLGYLSVFGGEGRNRTDYRLPGDSFQGCVPPLGSSPIEYLQLAA